MMSLIDLPPVRILRQQAVFLAVIFLACGQPIGKYRDFSGDASFRDRGCCFRYPRFRIEFDPIPIGSGRTVSKFRVERAPESEYHLMLVALPGVGPQLTREDSVALPRLAAEIEIRASVRIVDRFGKEQIEVGPLATDWILQIGDHEQAFYQVGDDFPPALSAPFVVTVEIEAHASGRAPLLSLQPILVGGGRETI